MFNLWDTLGHESEPIKIIDVGAMMIGNTPPDYQALLKPGVSEVIGFEPDQEECRKLNQVNSGNCLYLPYIIGDGSEQNFRVCNYNMTSSLYEPNIDLLDKFQAMSEFHQVVKRSTVPTKRLDDTQSTRVLSTTMQDN